MIEYGERLRRAIDDALRAATYTAPEMQTEVVFTTVSHVLDDLLGEAYNKGYEQGIAQGFDDGLATGETNA